MAFAGTRQRAEGSGETPTDMEGSGVTLTMAGWETAKWQALCMDMTTNLCAVMGNTETAEYVARAPPNESNKILSYLLERMGYPKRAAAWLGACARAPNTSAYPIPPSGLDTVDSEALPPVITITDSFGSFGKKNSNSNPLTCSTEFSAAMDGRADPWNIKPYPGEGIGAFVKHLSNFSRIAIEEPKDTEPFSAATWPPVTARPTNASVVVIGWFGNELCEETYVNSLGHTVPKPPAGKK